MAVSREESIAKYGTEAYTGWGSTEAEYDARAHPEKLNTYNKQQPVATPAVAVASALPSYQDFAATQAAEEKALLAKYGLAVGAQETLPAAYERLTTEEGLPQLQSDIQKYKNEIYKTQSLLDTLEENVNERTKGTLTTEAQRQRQIAAEAAPLASALGRQATGLQPLAEQLGTATSNVQTKLGLLTAQQEKDLQPLLTEMNMFSDRAAREVSLYTTERQGELNQIQQKLVNTGNLSVAEYTRASDLLKIEATYKAEKDKIDTQSAADIKKYWATTGAKTTSDTDKYKQPVYSPIAGEGSTAISGGVSWRYTNGTWVPIS